MPLCKGYSPCKMVSLGPKLKFTKTCQKCLYYHTRIVLRKKQLQKRANIRKMTVFRKWPNWPLSKGFSPCKMVSLGPKLKFTKTCKKCFYYHIRVIFFLCGTRKKQLQKRANNRKMTVFRKWPKLASMQGLKPTQNCQFGSKIKIHKNMRKTTLQ